MSNNNSQWVPSFDYAVPQPVNTSGRIQRASGYSTRSIDLNQDIRGQFGERVGSVDLNRNILDSNGYRTGKNIDADGNIRSAGGGFTGLHVQD